MKGRVKIFAGVITSIVIVVCISALVLFLISPSDEKERVVMIAVGIYVAFLVLVILAKCWLMLYDYIKDKLEDWEKQHAKSD